MLDGEAHLSTTSEGELRIWWFGLSKTQSGLGYQSTRSRSYFVAVLFSALNTLGAK